MINIIGNLTIVQYFIAITIGSFLGIVLSEVLLAIFKPLKNSIEKLETDACARKIYIGVALLALPLAVKIMLHVSEIEPALLLPKICSSIQYLLVAFFIIGAIYLIRGFISLYLALRYER